MNTGIYEIRNIVTGKRYIGSAVHFRRRKAVHLALLRAGKHRNAKLQASWDKHGERAFEFRLLVVCGREDLVMYEQRLIDGFNTVGDGYNLLPVAGSALGFRHSNQHKASLAGNQNARGMKHSDETRRRLAQASLGNKHGLGHKRSAEHRAAISLAHKGRKQSPEQVAKRVAATQATKRAKAATGG